MDLTHTEERIRLAESVRSVVTREWTTATVRELQASASGFDPARWKRIAELGWTAIAVPEHRGGFGGGYLDLVVVLEELGRGAVSSPLAATVAHGVLPVLWRADSTPAARHLDGLVAGETIACPADLEPDGRSTWPDRPAPATAAGWTVSGTKMLVPFAEVADLLLVTTRLDGPGEAVIAVPRTRDGVRLHRQRLPVGDPVYRLDLADVEITAADLVASGPDAIELHHRGAAVATVLACAYAVGLCESALRIAVDHAKSREQFGRPIGSFQSVSNRCADMRVETDAFRMLTYEAAWLLDQEREAGLAVAKAKAYGNLTVRTVAGHAHQILAGMGMSTEHDLYLFTRRARTFEQTGGSHAGHLHRVADRIGL